MDIKGKQKFKRIEFQIMDVLDTFDGLSELEKKYLFENFNSAYIYKIIMLKDIIENYIDI